MLKPARWLIPKISEREVSALASEWGLCLPVARVLWQRGIREAEAVRRFLRPRIEDLHDPFLLRDMDRAASRLAKAVRGGEHVLVYGDYDVDGTTSVVILKKGIELAGGQATFHVPDRFEEGYGMRPEVMERAAAGGVGVVVSVDTGIRARESARRAAELGVDVIVTDHHLPEDSLPPALAVVNPNRPDCSYPNKNLCGAGVVLKLIQALLDRLDWPRTKARRLIESLMKMVAIATVADVVPLVGENRVIVKYGLDGLRDVRNPGLRALMDVAGFGEGDRPTAGQVAFRIAPRINAAGRMANASEVVNLFFTKDSGRAHDFAAALHQWNYERQEAEAAMVRDILVRCKREPDTDDQAALVFCGKDWHLGVVGIVASRLVERFHRPVFVLSIDGKTGVAQGSGRSIRAFHLLESLESMSDLFDRFGGHSQAAGLSLSAGRVPEFRRRMNQYAAERLTPEDFRPVCQADAVIDFAELSDRSAREILALEPFGCGNPAPVFAVLGAEVAGAPSVFKERHVRLPIRHNGRVLRVKGWNMAERTAALSPGQPIDVAITLEKDDYAAARGRPGWGLVLRELRPAAE